nr:hypothetical protein [uncultured Rhodococcus sp.]
MDAELLTLVNSGATTLLGLMVTDSWAKTKSAALKLLSPDLSTTAAIESDLEDSRLQLENARRTRDLEAEADIASEWRSRIRRRVTTDPQAVELLRDFVDTYTGVTNSAERITSNVSISSVANDDSRVYQQGQGSQFNY